VGGHTHKVTFAPTYSPCTLFFLWGGFHFIDMVCRVKLQFSCSLVAVELQFSCSLVAKCIRVDEHGDFKNRFKN